MTGAVTRLDQTIRSLVPFLLTLLLAVISVAPITMPFEMTIEPAFTLMAVFYWTIYRPDLMPAAAIFVVGVIQDLISGGVVGVTALLLLGTYGVVVTQRRLFLGKPFAVTWWGFLMVGLIAAIVSWALSSILAGQAMPLGPTIARYGLSVALFPLLVWLLIRTHRRVLPRIVS